MHAVRQSMRPKHQVLVLKCYPRYQKGVSEVKPNSSELSYLLYYASTRKSKILKVGAYLEEKTQYDVPRGRLGNVQVTLQILSALMDKLSRDIALFAPYVLRILTLVLSSKDISMVEETIPTFETFCEHQGHATLTIDQELAKLYDGVVRSYASFAEKQPSSERYMTVPLATRWNSAGLKALKSVSATDAIAMDHGKQLAIILPVLLKKTYSQDENFLLSLYHKAGLERDTPMRRRGSITTARSSAQIDRAIPVLSDTTAGADREAAEEAAMLAIHGLKQIFSAQNRVQTRLATSSVLSFLTSGNAPRKAGINGTPQSGKRTTWSTTLIEMIASWTPVQDRFVIVVTAMERLLRYAPSEENLSKQLTISRLIHHLLSSSINMIGLSVIDILLALMQQVLVILQVSGDGTNILPVPPRLSAIELFEKSDPKPVEAETPSAVVESPAEPSVVRQDLLKLLESCMADLATHIYYGDQISDIVAAILSRLKPSTTSSVPNPVVAIENPAAAAQVIAESGNLKEDPNNGEFFSFGTARVIALNAVKQVLVNANRRMASAGSGAIGRNKVSVRVWEGTQWLLRDEDRRVRRAYVSALLSWLSLEVDRKNLRIMDEAPIDKKNRAGAEKSVVGIARAASSASKSGRAKSLKTTFLQLLHLAVYDNVVETPEDNSDILLMHLLLTSLNERLGINAVKSGLPMVLRLQEDMETISTCNTLQAKVNVGSLVFGYLLSLSRVFDFETTMPGYEIGNEISRRKKGGLWLEPTQIPALAIDKIVGASYFGKTALDTTPDLKPFRNIQPLVNQLSIGYSNQQMLPPQSPPQSPSRGISLMSTSSILSHHTEDHELPQEFKDSLLIRWTKEACIASCDGDTKSSSPHGSRADTTRSVTNGLLSVKARSTRDVSGASPDNKAAHAGLAIITAGKRYRSASANGSGPPTPMSNIETHTLRMDDLKRVLAGHSMAEIMNDGMRRSSSIRGGSPLRSSTTHNFGSLHRNPGNDYRPSIASAGSDSFVNAEGFESASEGDLEHPLPTPQSPMTNQEMQLAHSMDTALENHETEPIVQRSSRPHSNSSASGEDPEANAKALKGDFIPPVIARIFGKQDQVPPVPPLPSSIKDTGPWPDTGSPKVFTATTPGPAQQMPGRSSLSIKRSTPSSLRQSTTRNTADAGVSSPRSFVVSLLDSIEVNDPDADTALGLPPY